MHFRWFKNVIPAVPCLKDVDGKISVHWFQFMLLRTAVDLADLLPGVSWGKSHNLFTLRCLVVRTHSHLEAVWAARPRWWCRISLRRTVRWKASLFPKEHWTEGSIDLGFLYNSVMMVQQKGGGMYHWHWATSRKVVVWGRSAWLGWKPSPHSSTHVAGRRGETVWREGSFICVPCFNRGFLK